MAGPVSAPIHGQFLPMQDNPFMQGNQMQGDPLLKESKEPPPFYWLMSDPQIG